MANETGTQVSPPSVPDFDNIFGRNDSPAETPVPEAESVAEALEVEDEEGGEEASAESAEFPKITKRFEEVPHQVFNDPNYYKTVLSNEGNGATRVHGILQKYLNAKDPKDRSVFRQQFITAFWDFLNNLAKKAAGQIPLPKRFLLRFAILHPTFLESGTRDFFSKIVVENELAQPVYYLDEWLKAIGNGAVRPSATDEARVPRTAGSIRIQQLLDKARGKMEGTRGLVKAKDGERIGLEKGLQQRFDIILEHSSVDGLPSISAPYSDGQKKAINEIQDLLKGLLKVDREQVNSLRDYYQSAEDVETLQQKMAEEGGTAQVDTGAVEAEFDTIRQMVKMTIGRQGNHFPVLSSEYFHSAPNDIGFRENVISVLARIESIDPECFVRVYKNRNNRIVPYVILIPSYGDMGLCWEPFDRHNRATSRGRIAIPMYSKSLYTAILIAVADLRWQVAKEKANFYWMEEGLTGNYYQWFQKMKLKGNIKDYFVQDYIIWMTKECEGIQKLDKEIRGIFWRFIPFSQPVKEKLKTRNFVYQELYQRDLNRAMSDGY
ncbi:MAG: hypothetical protein LBH35_07950 [Treponema sp.]|jgi:hypothetical protein|nr:hypothetical protein [Treponema sp.]